MSKPLSGGRRSSLWAKLEKIKTQTKPRMAGKGLESTCNWIDIPRLIDDLSFVSFTFDLTDLKVSREPIKCFIYNANIIVIGNETSGNHATQRVTFRVDLWFVKTGREAVNVFLLELVWVAICWKTCLIWNKFTLCQSMSNQLWLWWRLSIKKSATNPREHGFSLFLSFDMRVQ